ncbi:hypothetical protein L6164_017104 [Bauhinia variegata]|uniref:Uncharacterized protein n=1 Tax=Bauhinia variegata TaxID=167791 RepID=A0ACB9N6V4_BAUVA|nr:hypothetical protein L6164_017104 [Bauhinia variegata]
MATSVRSDDVSVDPEIETPFVLDTVDAPLTTKAGQSSDPSVEVAERFAYGGIESNLITYLTRPLQQSTATAAANVNIWDGTASLLPLLGGFVADSYLGRYRTILVASLIYILGLGLLTISAMLPSLSNSECRVTDEFTSCSSQFQVILLFFSLYLVAIGQGGHKPCVQAFGVDQFDERHPKECKARSSFFNWWYFTMCAGMLATVWILNYIQDNLSWVLGFGIPCLAMIIALIVFLLGTKTYRFNIEADEKSPFVRIGRVFVAAIQNRRTSLSDIAEKEESCGILTSQSSEEFKFLNRALFTPKGSKEEETCSLSEVEEAKAVLRLVPIWATCLIFAILCAQCQPFSPSKGLLWKEPSFQALTYLLHLFKRFRLWVLFSSVPSMTVYLYQLQELSLRTIWHHNAVTNWNRDLSICNHYSNCSFC